MSGMQGNIMERYVGNRGFAWSNSTLKEDTCCGKKIEWLQGVRCCLLCLEASLLV